MAPLDGLEAGECVHPVSGTLVGYALAVFPVANVEPENAIRQVYLTFPFNGELDTPTGDSQG